MGALLSGPVEAMVVERCKARCWTASAVTMQGWRKTHEDAHVFQCDVRSGSNEAAVVAVLDGHGGSLAATEGAKLLEQRLVALSDARVLESSGADKEIQRAFLSTDEALRELLRVRDDRSGTTVVAAVVTRTGENEFRVQMAHSGDSRALVRTAAGLHFTEDHKPNRIDEQARITAAGGSVEHGQFGGPMRVDGSLAVSRALGDFHFKPASKEPELCKVTALPETKTVTGCQAGDWLLLACDGVFDVFSNEEAQEFLEGQLRAGAEEGVICRDLIRASLDKGSKDNCTALLLRFTAPQTPVAVSRELVHGDPERAAPEVREKYCQFLEATGFAEESRKVRALPAAGGDDLDGRSSGAPPGGMMSSTVPATVHAGAPPETRRLGSTLLPPLDDAQALPTTSAGKQSDGGCCSGIGCAVQ